MRLKEPIIHIIKNSAIRSFGEVDIYLFGSRLDDNKKGGDIDIAVDSDLSRVDFRKHKAKFMANLLRLGFDMKIDLVPYNTKDELLFHQIHTYGVKIN